MDTLGHDEVIVHYHKENHFPKKSLYSAPQLILPVVPPIMKSFLPIKSNLLTFIAGGPILNKAQGKFHLFRGKVDCLFHSNHFVQSNPFFPPQDVRKVRFISQWGLFQNGRCTFVPLWVWWQVALSCQFPGAEIEFPQQAFLAKAPINKRERRPCS